MLIMLAFGSGVAASEWNRRRGRDAGRPVTAVRWEKAPDSTSASAIQHVRRRHPALDAHVGVRFLDVVQPRGADASYAIRRCSEWEVAIMMVDKRTGLLDRIVLFADDVHEGEKRWILRRVGIKVVTIASDADADAVAEAMAA